MLLEAKADVEFREAKRGTTPLWMATSNNHFDVVELLISSGANVNLRASDPTGSGRKTSPLSFAVQRNFCDVAEALIEAGADLSTAHNSGAG
jgi:ankyrin repeat protein